ncbi:unnamed protein product [Oikopleura dioica]|uniref:SPRY domain-containing protein 7 n=1 Tax=Oikopleura dioica TaxID=34765 RepID=E4WR00_OIKDI|nr:unnamed protein product [Oikopleura dioica]
MNILATCCGPCFGWETLVEEPEDATSRPQVKLDALNMGLDAVIVKNGTRVCGTGAVLGTAAIMQDKAYFEVKVQSDGIWGCGVAAEQCDLNKVPTVDKSWVLTSERTIQKEGKDVESIEEICEGDVIGVTYDHVELQFYLNSNPIGNPVTGIRGKIYPILYVDESAILDAEFVHFRNMPPSGFGQIMFEQNIL